MSATDHVLVGAPERSEDPDVVGYAYRLPLTAALPTSTTTPLPASAEDLGFVSEDGLTISTDRTVEIIRDWNLDDVRALLTEHGATVSFTLINWSIEALRAFFGPENVTETADEIVVRINARAIGDSGWVFNMKDLDRKRRVVIPRGSLASQGEITLVKGEQTPLQIELTPLVDGHGEKIYIYTQKAGSSSGTGSGSGSGSA
ncbi:hypothetical protein M3B43_07415 [Nesterenkonia massiliensis]|uniref:Major tail protein n=1 Tax=Nesterenkonia massiliensis TaxID=1232429 RepID=A0ABT2HR52_9MICC|nr:hypothetical protein [Nesterenkonia massiliensis]MCT1607156.1 hypothetical protein [Nesterenkonia massiliensis]